MACLGTEVHLAACPLEFNYGNATKTCPGGMPAVVSCVPGPLYTQNNAMKKKLKVSVNFDVHMCIKYLYDLKLECQCNYFYLTTSLSLATVFCTSEGWSETERGPC